LENSRQSDSDAKVFFVSLFFSHGHHQEKKQKRPNKASLAMRLLLAHLTWNSKRLLGAMVLDRLGVEMATTR